MPLTQTVSFTAVVQKGRRIQIPRLIRWRFKLEPTEVFDVQVWPLTARRATEHFYAKMSRDGRITIPKLQAKILAAKAEEETLEGYAVDVTLSPIEEGEED